jgi:hypothetical protein
MRNSHAAGTEIVTVMNTWILNAKRVNRVVFAGYFHSIPPLSWVFPGAQLLRVLVIDKLYIFRSTHWGYPRSAFKIHFSRYVLTESLFQQVSCGDISYPWYAPMVVQRSFAFSSQPFFRLPFHHRRITGTLKVAFSDRSAL